MYLSRIAIDLRRYETMRALHERERLHAMVESCFPGPRQRRLWRLDSLHDIDYLLLLSGEAPNLRELGRQIGCRGAIGEIKDYTPLLRRIAPGTVWRFRLTANPTESIPSRDGSRGRVRAVTVVARQREWLARQGASHGFAVADGAFDVTRTEWLRFRKPGHAISLLCTTFEGILTVTDAAQFLQALTEGIGRGKAYGMGLLTVIPYET